MFFSKFNCGVPTCDFQFRTGPEHLAHLISHHGYQQYIPIGPSSPSARSIPSAPSLNSSLNSSLNTSGPGAVPSVIFQDPTIEHDIYISYCPDNCSGGTAVISEYHDPQIIAATLSKTFKPWFASVSLAQPTGDFYEDRALALQKVKVVVALITPQYSHNEECQMEYQFAMLSLKKPVLSVLLKSNGELSATLQNYMSNDNRVPFHLEGAIPDEESFHEKMEFLKDAIKKMINEVNTTRETARLETLTLTVRTEDEPAPPSYQQAVAQQEALLGAEIRGRVPQVGDHVIAHWQQHSYFTATIIRFVKADMKFEIMWDDQDESGRFPPVTMVALDKVPEVWEVALGSRVFFPQGSYCGQAGVRTGGIRYHEGIVTLTENVPGGRLRCYGKHLKGDSDGKWVTYQKYNQTFCCFSDELRVAPNPFNVSHAYANM